MKVICFWWENLAEVMPTPCPSEGVDSLWSIPSFLCLFTSPTPLWLHALLEAHHTWSVLRQGKRPHEEERSPSSTSQACGWNTQAPVEPQMIPDYSQHTSLFVQIKMAYIQYTQHNVFIHMDTSKGVNRYLSSNLLRCQMREVQLTSAQACSPDP